MAAEMVSTGLEDQPIRPEDVAVARRRSVDAGLWFAVSWLAFVIALAVLAPVLPLEDPLALTGDARQGPSGTYPLGTDQLSRDMLSRAIHGARISLFVGITAAVIAGTVGTLCGLAAGYYRRWSETAIMGVADILLAVPALIFVIVITSMLGPGVSNVILAISVLGIPAFARVVRAQTMVFAERDFVKAARSLGATRRRILFLEIAPNVMPTVISYALVTVSIAIVVEGSLSFLGLGVPPEEPTWGGMIAQGRSHLQTSPHISLIPAAIMFVTVLALNAFGDKLQRRRDGAVGVVA